MTSQTQNRLDNHCCLFSDRYPDIPLIRENFDFSSLKGGSPEEIMAKINTYRLADIRYSSSKDLEEKEFIIYDFGEYCYLEQYSRYFEHKKKDFKR